MTKEQCREAGATMIAWADGKSIQYRRRDQSEWFDIEPACTATTLSWDWDDFEYRVKPETKLRPWTADEVPARACRIIERELNAANERIRRLEELVEQLTNPKFTRDDLPKEALLQRIKRLEEAGDHLCSLLGVDSIEAHMGRESWSEAKEAKP